MSRARLQRVTTSTSKVDRAVRDATDQFLDGDASVVVDELTEALISVSARISVFRKRLPASDALACDLRAVDDAFTHSVALARRLSIAIRAQEDPGACTDVGRIARDLGKHLSPVMPEGVPLTLVCPAAPALAAMSPSDVRRIFSLLIRRVLDDVAGRAGGDVTLEVCVFDGSEFTSPRGVRVQIWHRALRPAVAADAAEDVRPKVHANGGSVEPCARVGGGAAVVVLLPSAC
jgi:hypothetical protein